MATGPDTLDATAGRHSGGDMKTLCEEVLDLFRELRDSWHPPVRRARHRPAAAAAAEDISPQLPPEDLHFETLARAFPRELFAQLLIELPDYRTRMVDTYAAGNYRRLRDSVHQILGAAAYCEAVELAQGLRQLRLALKTDDDRTIEYYYHRAIRAIDNTLHDSGYREDAE